MEFNPEKAITSIIDDASALIFYTDIDGRVLMCNKEFERIMGLPRGSIINSDYLKVVYRRATSIAGNEQVFKAMVDDAVRYKRPGNFESILSDGSGNEYAICWSITPISAGATMPEGVLFLGNDISSSRGRESALKSMDDTLKNIFSSIKEYALYAINLDGNITYYGMGAEAMFGWNRNEIIFKHVSSLHLYDDVSYKFPFILEQVRKLGRYELETYFIKKDGHSFPANLTVSKFTDAQDNITGYIFMVKDITERRKLEYQIFQSEKLAAVGQLVAGIAHEINNPVFVISGRTDMMLARKPLSKKVKNDLKVIDAQVNRIRKLVNRFLAFTRKTTPNAGKLDINKTIKSVLPLLSYHRLPIKGIKIVKLFAKDILPMRGDSHQLQEVFVNLFINSYQAMPEGGLLTIKTSNLADEFAQIVISDTGCGIPPEGLKNIFMPFFTTKKEGTGLGLSICYNIIKNHGGTIDVESSAGQGTTFIIKLPFIKEGGKDGL